MISGISGMAPWYESDGTGERRGGAAMGPGVAGGGAGGPGGAAALGAGAARGFPGSVPRPPPAFRSAEAVPAPKRRKQSEEGPAVAALHRLVATFPDGLAAYSAGLRMPELAVLQELMDMEKVVDDLLWQKKMDITEALKVPESSSPRTLQISVVSVATKEPQETGSNGAGTGDQPGTNSEPKAESIAGSAAAGTQPEGVDKAGPTERAKAKWSLKVIARVLESAALPEAVLATRQGPEGGEGLPAGADALGGQGAPVGPAGSDAVNGVESRLEGEFRRHVKRLEVQVGPTGGSAAGADGSGGAGQGNTFVWLNPVYATPSTAAGGASKEPQTEGPKDKRGAKADGGEAKDGKTGDSVEEWGDDGLVDGGFPVDGVSDKDVDAEVRVFVKHTPEKFQLSSELQALLGLEVETRPRILQALWHYIKKHMLQDSADPSFITCDEPLQAIFKEAKVKLTTLPARIFSHLRAPPPVVIRHRIAIKDLLGAEGAGAGEAEDIAMVTAESVEEVTVDVTPASHFEKLKFLQGLEASQRDVATTEDALCRDLMRVEERRRRRAFLLAFAHSPVNFVNALVASQSTDLATILRAPNSVRRQHQRSALFSEPWAEDAVLRYLQRQLEGEAANTQ